MKYILSSLIIFVIFSCKKDFPLQIVGTGEIATNVRSVTVPNLWVYPKEMTESNQIIKSEKENVFKVKMKFLNDTTYRSIDFSKYTLLGKYVNTYGCDVVFERDVKEITIDQKYIYNIKVHKDGECTKSVSTMNWVLIPRMLDGYIVEFNVERIDY